LEVTTFAVTVIAPRIVGFQEQVWLPEYVIEMHPEILLPFAKKVILPDAPPVAVMEDVVRNAPSVLVDKEGADPEALVAAA
jgi:hypothetical protein